MTQGIRSLRQHLAPDPFLGEAAATTEQDGSLGATVTWRTGSLDVCMILRMVEKAVRLPRSLWKASDLQRRYREVLDAAAEHGEVHITDRAQEWTLLPREQADVLRGVRDGLAHLAQLESALQRFPNTEPREWATITPYPWLASLTIDEVRDFVRDLAAHLMMAASLNSFVGVEGVLAAWQSTAEISNDPEALAAMLAPLDHQRIEEIFAPAAPYPAE